MNHCRHTKNQQDIIYIRADDIADGNGGTALIGSHHTRGKFRQRRATGHDRQSDDTLAQTETVGHVRGAIHKEVTADDQTGQAEHYQRQVAPQLRIVLRQLTVIFKFLLRRHQTVFLSGPERIDQEGHKACQQDETVAAADLITPEVRRVHIVEAEHEQQEGSHNGEGDILPDGRLGHRHRSH